MTRIRTRSVLTCEAAHGVCAACYGQSLATGRMIELGEAVGVIAAQSIGEPGTQLTMRTFHTGGIVGEDITHGLPRVVELFEARTPKGAAVLARHSGRRPHRGGGGRPSHHRGGRRRHRGAALVAARAHLEVADGQEVGAGDALVEGPKDPKELLEVKGIRETQQYLVEEVQKVYRDQGVSIHDKHIELIVRQMLRRVLVAEPGDAPFLPGERVDNQIYAEVNRQLVEEGKRPAEGRPELMGITKASLATDSWLSAASFQETTRVLTEAAIEGKSDQLFGLKENIIIGKLIPAGTGMERYRDIRLEMPDAEAMPFWAPDLGRRRHRGPGCLAARRRRRRDRCDDMGNEPFDPSIDASWLGAGPGCGRRRRPGRRRHRHRGGSGRGGRLTGPLAWQPPSAVPLPPCTAPRLRRAPECMAGSPPRSSEPRGNACPRSPSSSARDGRPRRPRPRPRPSRARPSAGGSARASTRPPRRSRTRPCARWPASA